MAHLSVYAFGPFAALLGCVCIAGAISAWIEFAARAIPRRRAPLQTAEILYFPVPRPAADLAGAAERRKA